MFYFIAICYIIVRVIHGESPWINSGKFQGDIAGYDQSTFDALIQNLNDWQERRQEKKDRSTGIFESAISDPRGLWLNARMPYVVESSDGNLHAAVAAAMKDIQDSTCVRFVRRTNEPDYVRIIDTDSGCYSFMGNIHRGGQVLNLGPGCKHKGTASHELMHALGFWHEQQRTDRDDHIIVTLENVEHRHKDQYLKAKTSDMNLIGRYDMDSVMHYGSWAFALPGKKTMRAKHSQRTDFGGDVVTNEDKRKIRILYRCDDGDGDSSIAAGVTYFIKAEGTDNCWDVPGQNRDEGTHLQQWDCNQTPAQQWQFVRLNHNVYAIRNVGNGLYANVRAEEINQEGGKIQQWGTSDPLADKNFHFKIVPKNGVFHITAVSNGRIVWVDTKGKLRHWKHDGGQNWKFERMTSATSGITTGVVYFIKEANKCWDVPGTSRNEGEHLQEWDCNRSPAQQWIFTQLNNNVYAIKNVGTGQYANVRSEEVQQQGGKIQQWNANDPRQDVHFHFKIEPRDGLFHVTSVANGRIVWVDTHGKLRHWQHDGGQNWKFERM